MLVTMEDESEGRWGLFLPFNLVQSRGGPYDDAAFVSGWRLGAIDAAMTIEVMKDTHEVVSAMVQCEELDQLDLIAMARGFMVRQTPAIHLQEDGTLTHEWHNVELHRVRETVSGVPVSFLD